jgi:enoyl-[acyl-carrier protein] reductase III
MEVNKPVFDGKNYWALILGGSSGLGLASARKLAAAGMNLIVIHRDSRIRVQQIEGEFEKMRSLVTQLISINKNALDQQAISSMVAVIQEHLRGTGKIRILLHSIARGNLKPLSHSSIQAPPDHGHSIKEFLDGYGRLESDEKTSQLLSEEDLLLTIQAMGTSIWQWTQALVDSNLFASDARVVGLTSEGSHKAWKYYAAVSAAKSVLESLSRSIALELAPLGIRSNIIQSGVVETESLNMIPGKNKLKALSLLRNPFGRLTQPEDVANAVYLLALDEAAWINGAVIRVDGGESIA